MSVLRTLVAIVRIAARTIRMVAVGAVASGRFVGRWVLRARQHAAGGETGMVRLLDLHAASCAGDTLIAIGLAGTIFFTVPADDARSKVAVYLLVTMLPFALLAPVIGPTLDRFRHGRRYALAATMLGRAFLAYVVSEHIGGFALYPAAFGVLVLSRAYGVARGAAVPRVIPPGLSLSEAAARASVFGTLAGAVVAPVGVAAAAFGPEWALRVATVIFTFGMVTALRLPPRADAEPPETMPRLFQRPGRRGVRVLSGRLLVTSLLGSASLRTIYGFLALYLAFAIRAGDLPTELAGRQLSQGATLGLVAGALGTGSFLATAVGTKLRIRRPALVQACGLVLATVAAGAAAFSAVLPLVAVLCLVTAVASGLAKLAVDAVISERSAEQVRSSAFAHSETLLMIAWVAGGGLGLVPFPGRAGLLVVAALAGLAAVRAVAAAAVLRTERLSGVPVESTATTTAVAALPAGTGTPPAKAPPGQPGKGRWRRRRDREPADTLTLPAAADPRPGGTPTAAQAGPTQPGPTQAAPGRPAPAQTSTAEPAPRIPAPKRAPARTRRLPAAGDPLGPTGPTGSTGPTGPGPDPGGPDDPADGTPGYHLYRPSGFDDGDGDR